MTIAELATTTEQSVSTRYETRRQEEVVRDVSDTARRLSAQYMNRAFLTQREYITSDDNDGRPLRCRESALTFGSRFHDGNGIEEIYTIVDEYDVGRKHPARQWLEIETMSRDGAGLRVVIEQDQLAIEATLNGDRYPVMDEADTAKLLDELLDRMHRSELMQQGRDEHDRLAADEDAVQQLRALRPVFEAVTQYPQSID